MIKNMLNKSVTVVARNNLWKYRANYAFPMDELQRYIGTVLKPVSWAPDSLCLSTGDKSFPFRLIPLVDIVSIDGVVQKPIPVPQATYKTWEVKGSKDNIYTVTLDNDRWSCTCVGYGFHRDCKHIQLKKKERQ